MEGVFLKTSIQNEMDQFQPEDSSFLLPNVSNVDDFFIDELLDFSNEDGFMFEEAEQNEDNPTTLISSKARSSCGLSLKEDFALVSSSELDVPVEELESLEWLSHFVEDSNSEYSTPFPAGVFQPKPESQPEKTFQPAPCFKTPVPAKARSKRTRTGAKIWSLGSPSITESSSSSTSSSSCSSLVLDPVEPVEKPVKKPKKKPSKGDGFPSTAMPRRCSHCGVQKTPQWRAGPLGPKTLCNACGVRFKSGRLFPEYRPACSPTFSSELHSNHHRKVLEMRKKKDAVLGEPGVLVPSF